MFHFCCVLYLGYFHLLDWFESCPLLQVCLDSRSSVKRKPGVTVSGWMGKCPTQHFPHFWAVSSWPSIKCWDSHSFPRTDCSVILPSGHIFRKQEMCTRRNDLVLDFKALCFASSFMFRKAEETICGRLCMWWLLRKKRLATSSVNTIMGGEIQRHLMHSSLQLWHAGSRSTPWLDVLCSHRDCSTAASAPAARALL